MINSSIIDFISTGVCVLDQELNIMVWNRLMEERTGLDGREVFGKNISDYFSRFKEESIKMRLEMVLNTGAPIVFSSLLHRDMFISSEMDEHSPFFEIIVTSFELNDGAKTLLFTVNDVTELNQQILRFREMRDTALDEVEKRKIIEQELREVNDKLEQVASTDPLTGLSNRRNIIRTLQVEMDRSLRHKKVFSVILSDIDFFKKVNDTYGHDCGDYVLKDISLLMKENLRSVDMVSRWGGEEFLLALPETEGENAIIAAEKLRRSIENHSFSYEGVKLKITMTFGITEYQSPEKNIDEMVKRADVALYEGKEKGRNCVVLKA